MQDRREEGGWVARVVTRGLRAFGGLEKIHHEFVLCLQFSSREVSKPAGTLAFQLSLCARDNQIFRQKLCFE